MSPLTQERYWANAYFDTNTNEYHVALDAVGGASVYLAAHESIHDIAKNNAAGYANVRRVTFDVLKQNGQNIDALIKAAQDKEGMTAEAAEEEVIANTVPAIFRDADMRQRFAESMAKEDADTRNAFEKFIGKVRELLDKAYDALKKQKSWKQMQAVENDRQGLEAMMDAYTEALKGRADIEATGIDVARYSVKEDMHIKEQLESVSDKLNKKTAVINISAPLRNGRKANVLIDEILSKFGRNGMEIDRQGYGKIVFEL